MLEINLSKICKAYNGKKVLDNFSLELKTGEHIALIGPNLMECVKGYMKHEKEVIMEVTKLRMSYAEGATQETAEKLNDHYTNMIALVEAYPEIKAGENFLHLQKELADVESEISAARRIYSTSITTYNNKVQTFPSNIFASIFGYKTVEPIKFDVDDVQVKF